MIGMFTVLMEDLVEDESSQVLSASLNIELLPLEGCSSAVGNTLAFHSVMESFGIRCEPLFIVKYVQNAKVHQ